MLLIFVFIGSFVTALGIGYLGMAADQGIKVVAESKVGAKVGKWLFLLPVLDLVDHLAAEVIPPLIQRIVRAVGSGLTIALVIALTCLALAAVWFLGGILISALLMILPFLWRHLGWIILILLAIFTVIQLAKRL